MSILAIIPARAGSKRLPGKNMLLLGGIPLVQRTIEMALKCMALDTIVVNSDDPKVLDLARRYSRVIPIARPGELATDTSPAIDYVRHTIAEIAKSGLQDPDIVVILQVTSPLTRPEDVDQTVHLLRESGADSAVTVTRLEQSLQPAKLKRLEGNRLLSYQEDENGIKAAHELPELYVRNGSVYAATRRVIDSGRIIGADCRALVMPRERSVDINDALDYHFAEFLLQRAGEPGKKS
ncbi:MAG: CMP-N,N'-diacetyllegionaminic acid synthase [Myxococcota bacterium]|nr:CMP-N,N'-diacetyllegionaminic acid synthase [Myxococcota bacterium]